jgi:peptidoglycan/xylan/chitin deacetylase (PgdA/CDA1 family)
MSQRRAAILAAIVLTYLAPLSGQDLALAPAGKARVPTQEGFRPRGYYSGDPLPPRTVYLSFDDGPWDFTSDILDVLAEEGVHATFFLNSYDKDNPAHGDPGANVLLRYADTLRRMVREGHAIGNHTYSHQDLARLDATGIAFQLDTLERDLRQVLGSETPVIHLIRPPFGSPWLGDWNSPEQRRRVGQILARRGLVMMWTIGWDSSDSSDWAPGEWFEKNSAKYKPGGPAYELKVQREAQRILKRADGEASGVILMHDTHPTSRDVLKALIEELKRRGYSFGTLEDYARWRWGKGAFDNPPHPARPLPLPAEPPSLPGAGSEG